MKVKIIDLLNKIANGEEAPKKIATEEETYEYIPIACDYKTKDGVGLMDYWLFKDFTFGSNGNYLDYEVEIIEEDIEHYDMFDYFTGYEFGGTNKDLLDHLERNFVNINKELDYLCKEVNKLKKDQTKKY